MRDSSAQPEIPIPGVDQRAVRKRHPEDVWTDWVYIRMMAFCAGLVQVVPFWYLFVPTPGWSVFCKRLKRNGGDDETRHSRPLP
jgi:hypothetical protein